MTLTTVILGSVFLGALALLVLAWLLIFLGKQSDNNLDLYPPPGPPRPAPAPKPKVVNFPPVQLQPKPMSEELHRIIVEAQNPLPPAPPAPHQNITFAPWVTEEEKQRILENWRNRR